MTEVDLPINILLNKEILITPERIRLLRLIKQAGSINFASKAVSISYQNAWHAIEQMNMLASRPIVVKQRGGNGGGGAQITEFGDLILKEYSYIEQKVLDFSKQLNTELNL